MSKKTGLYIWVKTCVKLFAFIHKIDCMVLTYMLFQYITTNLFTSQRFIRYEIWYRIWALTFLQISFKEFHFVLLKITNTGTVRKFTLRLKPFV
jgi:hypothetical protein